MDISISELAKDIAQYLEDWEAAKVSREAAEYDTGQDHGRLTHSSGAGIYLCRLWNHRERVEVSGLYPKSADGSYRPTYGYGKGHCPEITCAIAKGAEAIAKDIGKRFMPKYWETFNWAKAQVAEYDRARKVEEDLLNRLADLLGSEVRYKRVVSDIGSVWIEIEPGYRSGEFKMILNRLSGIQAEKILGILAQEAILEVSDA